MEEGIGVQRWLLYGAVLWVIIYVVLGLIGDFSGSTVARSFLLAAAVTAGLALGGRRRAR